MLNGKDAQNFIQSLTFLQNKTSQKTPLTKEHSLLRNQRGVVYVWCTKASEGIYGLLLFPSNLLESLDLKVFPVIQFGIRNL